MVGVCDDQATFLPCPWILLHLPTGGFGLGHGDGAQAPEEYYVIESANPKVLGMDVAARSYVEFLYEMAA